MNLTYELVKSEQQIEQLAQLADEIWHEYWPDLIGKDQTDYMVDSFQSVEALSDDINHHDYFYYIVKDENDCVVGYTGSVCEYFADDPTNASQTKYSTKIGNQFINRLFISKIYLRKEERGKHYASDIIRFWNEFSKDHNLEGMYLTVNKGNDLGIRAYRGHNFETIDAVESDIGNGFIMDDYIMARPVVS